MSDDREPREAGARLSLCAAFALCLDRGHRVADRVHPAAGDQVTPGLAEPPKVGAELAAVGEPGPVGGIVEGEGLDHVGHRAAQQPEAVLDLRGNAITGMDRRPSGLSSGSTVRFTGTRFHRPSYRHLGHCAAQASHRHDHRLLPRRARESWRGDNTDLARARASLNGRPVVEGRLGETC